MTLSEEKDDIYPPAVAEIKSEQHEHELYKHHFCKKAFKKCDKRISLKVIDDQDIMVFEDKIMVIPSTDT